MLDIPARTNEPNIALQESKAMFLSALIDDRVQRIIDPLLAEFAEKGWPPEYYEVFFTRLSEAALQARKAFP